MQGEVVVIIIFMFSSNVSLCTGLYRSTLKCNQLWLCTVETEKQSIVFFSVCEKFTIGAGIELTDENSAADNLFSEAGWVISVKVMLNPVVTSNK